MVHYRVILGASSLVNRWPSLSPHISLRPTASELLKHPFFKKARERDYLVQAIIEKGPSFASRAKRVSLWKLSEALCTAYIPNKYYNNMYENVGRVLPDERTLKITRVMYSNMCF